MFRSQAALAGETRPRSRLGTRLALALLPLVVLPLLLMGSAAYVRSRAILEDQAVAQLSSAAQDQAQAIRTWATTREQSLQLGEQRASLRPPFTAMMATSSDTPAYQQARGQLAEALRELLTRENEVLFSAVLFVRLPDGLVVAATDSA